MGVTTHLLLSSLTHVQTRQGSPPVPPTYTCKVVMPHKMHACTGVPGLVVCQSATYTCRDPSIVSTSPALRKLWGWKNMQGVRDRARGTGVREREREQGGMFGE